MLPARFQCRSLFAWLVLSAAVLLPGTLDVLAAEPIAVKAEQPLRDPWVPPASRNPSTTPPAEGPALRAQVERKLQRDFDLADRSHTGSLTREQAAAGGLGYIAQHFDAIDRRKTGAVRFDDVKRYLIEQGAALD